jgi:rRNA maturation endonuclease Nob1
MPKIWRIWCTCCKEFTIPVKNKKPIVNECPRCGAPIDKRFQPVEIDEESEL